MKVELKSNGSQHTIPNKVWDSAPESFKRNYTVIAKTEEVTTTQVAENTSTKKDKKKEKETEENPKEHPSSGEVAN